MRRPRRALREKQAARRDEARREGAPVPAMLFAPAERRMETVMRRRAASPRRSESTAPQRAQRNPRRSRPDFEAEAPFGPMRIDRKHAPAHIVLSRREPP